MPDVTLVWEDNQWIGGRAERKDRQQMLTSLVWLLKVEWWCEKEHLKGECTEIPINVQEISFGGALAIWWNVCL